MVRAYCKYNGERHSPLYLYILPPVILHILIYLFCYYITELNEAVDTLPVFNTSDTIRSIANNITGSSGYINDAREVVTDGFNLIRGYDTPRYCVFNTYRGAGLPYSW